MFASAEVELGPKEAEGQTLFSFPTLPSEIPPPRKPEFKPGERGLDVDILACVCQQPAPWFLGEAGYGR